MSAKLTGKIKITPKDFFMNLLVFGALYASAVSFLALIFAYINVLFPDNLNYYSNLASEIITPSSVLMIIFPVFVLSSWLLSKDLAQYPEKKEIKFRKWLIYFTLFITAVTIIIDLITLVSNFYQGELTAQFVLKMLAVLLTASGIFWYYFLDLRDSRILKPKLSAWLVSLIFLGALAAGFFIVGTPAQQRAKRFDQQRINDLQIIQSQLLNYWIQKEELPENLDVLSQDQLSGFVLPQDPETELNYRYNKLTAFSFELCADFKTDFKDYPAAPYNQKFYNRKGLVPGAAIRIPYQYAALMDIWEHGTGENCFERTIDPELYKKTK